jgi:ABC-type multidrug transport system fused ATPase/permease subunit
MDDGNVLEYDTPQQLLSNPESAFSKLMRESRQDAHTA